MIKLLRENAKIRMRANLETIKVKAEGLFLELKILVLARIIRAEIHRVRVIKGEDIWSKNICGLRMRELPLLAKRNFIDKKV